jgi:hypothetical protein
MNRPIITYENIALLKSDFPAYSAESNSGNNISFLPLIESIDFSFDIDRTNVASLGTKSFVNQSITKAPDINITINSFEDFGDLFSSMFTSSETKSNLDFDRNFYAVVGDKRGVDVYGSNLSGKDVIGFGNCFLKDISMSQSVNGIINSSYSFVGSNVEAQALLQGGSVFSGKCPALNLSGNQSQDLSFQISEISGSSSVIETVIPHYSTNVTISGNGSVGNFLIKSDCIQNFSLDLPINRKDIYGIGKKYPLIRKSLFPNQGNFNFSNKVSTFEVSGVRANLKDFLNSEESYTLNISGQNYGKQAFNIQLNEARFQSQGNSLSISQELNSELSFNFDIHKCEVQLPNISGSLLLENSSHLLLSDGNFVLLEQG